jgi:ribosome biogenesis GTPase
VKIPAHIYEAHKKEFLCKIDSEDKTVSASATGTVLKSNQLVAGDKVLLEKSGSDYQITDLIDRTNEIFRMNIRERKKRITAANCDLVIIATSVSRPPYKQGVVDRFAIRSFQWDVPAVVVFNKMDEFQMTLILILKCEDLKISDRMFRSFCKVSGKSNQVWQRIF